MSSDTAQIMDEYIMWLYNPSGFMKPEGLYSQLTRLSSSP